MKIERILSENYLVSFQTFALIPEWIDGKLCTRVIESNKEFIIPMKPRVIMRKSLHFYGSTLKIATNYSRKVVGPLNKVPILVSHHYGAPLTMMPTLSPEVDDNIWVSFSAIEFYSQDEEGMCTVHFQNKLSFTLNASFTTMCRQFVLSHFINKHFKQTNEYLQHPAQFQMVLSPKPKETADES